MVYNAKAQKRYHKKYPERIREVHRKWREKNREHFNELMLKNKKKYELKWKARSLAWNKIKIPLNTLCSICHKNYAKERHHPDYSKPLDVLFVCKKCHERI